MTPDETIIFTDETSQRPGCAFRALRIGVAKESPTITRVSGWFRSMAASSSSASNFTPSSVMTVPPPSMAFMPVSRPVPCISGGAGRTRPCGPTALTCSARASSVSGTEPILRAAARVISRRS